MPRKINADNVVEWYDPYKLKAILLYRGIDNRIDRCAEILSVSRASVPYKINHGALSHADTITLCKALKMTPREYCDVFMKDVFEPEED